jgi:DNA-binding MarR family transcriptional regulator
MSRDEGEKSVPVSVSDRDVRAALRLLRTLTRVEADEGADSLLPSPSRPPAVTSDRTALIEKARLEFTDRRRRCDLFGSSMFGEAAWDMLLALYILDVSGQRQTVGSLQQFSGTSASTAKRWLEYLACHDLVERQEHPTDRRTAFVTLTLKAREKLDLYYSGTSSPSI